MQEKKLVYKSSDLRSLSFLLNIPSGSSGARGTESAITTPTNSTDGEISRLSRIISKFTEMAKIRISNLKINKKKDKKYFFEFSIKGCHRISNLQIQWKATYSKDEDFNFWNDARIVNLQFKPEKFFYQIDVSEFQDLAESTTNSFLLLVSCDQELFKATELAEKEKEAFPVSNWGRVRTPEFRRREEVNNGYTLTSQHKISYEINALSFQDIEKLLIDNTDPKSLKFFNKKLKILLKAENEEISLKNAELKYDDAKEGYIMQYDLISKKSSSYKYLKGVINSGFFIKREGAVYTKKFNSKFFLLIFFSKS